MAGHGVAIVGIEVPRAVAEKLAGLGAPGSPEAPETMHITVLYLGKDAPVESVLAATDALYRVCRRTPPFNVGFAVRTSFPDRGNGTPVIARVISPALHRFRAELMAELDAAGVFYDTKFPDFKPHVTVSYCDSAVPDAPMEPTVWTVGSIAVWGGDSGRDRLAVKVDLAG